MNKNIIIFAVFLILSINLVSSELYIENTQIMITSTNDRFLKNQAGALFFNVFNSTGSLLPNTEANCNISIFNKTNVVLFDSLDYTSSSFYKNLSTDIYQKENIYTYTIYCNSSTQSGFSSGSFEVSSSSNFSLFDSSNKGISLIISILGILFLLSYIMLSLGKEHFLFSFFLIFVVIFSISMLPTLFLGNFNPVTLLKATTWVSRIFIIYVFMFILYKTVFKVYLDKVWFRVFKGKKK